MPRSSSVVPTKPEVLKWARDYSGLTLKEAAEQLAIPQSQLREIELGHASVNNKLFTGLKSVYNLTESILLLPSPPQGVDAPPDFRSIGEAKTRLTSATREVIRDARRLQTLISDLLDEVPELMPRPDIGSATVSDDSEEVAEREREKFGVSIEAQFDFGTRSGAYNKWRLRLEQFGVLVIQKPMLWEDCRGFSLSDNDLVPLICVNSTDSENGRIFTLFHEYAHLVLKSPGTCLAGPGTDQIPIESWCNSFSAAFLMPRVAVLDAVGKRYPDLDEWEERHIKNLATQFRVSQFAMGRRLKEIGITDLYDQLKLDWYRFDKRQPTRTNDRQKDFRREPRQRTIVREIGSHATSVVLEAVREYAIEPGEAAEFLDLEVDRLRELDELAHQTERRHSHAS